jgi:hypothetical protein
MRSIMVCTTVILAIAGLIHAQNRRLETKWNLSAYLDLASNTGMGTTDGTAFINQFCNIAGPANIIRGAINVETNETMPWKSYRSWKGPGFWAKGHFNYATYPWSTFKGRCYSVLNTSWVTDQAAARGPATKNINWRTRSLTLYIDQVFPQTKAMTTQSGWTSMMGNATWLAHFFLEGVQNASSPLARSAYWFEEDVPLEYKAIGHIPECTEAWLTSVTVARTITAFSGFTLERYSWASKSQGKWWNPTEGGRSDNWMTVKKDNEGEVKAHSTGFKTLYSSEMYVRAETLCRLLPGTYPEALMMVQVDDAPLPPQNCHLG